VRALMLTIDRFTRRRRRLVLAAWVALVAAAVPFAQHQSDNLTSGGFAVPGSQSNIVDRAVKHDFPNAAQAQMSALLVRAPGGKQAEVRLALDRLRRAVADTPRVGISRRAERAALLTSRHRRTVIVPLKVTTNEDMSQDVANDLRDKLGIGDSSPSPVQIHLLGEGALWAGLEAVYHKDLAQSELLGFPVVLIVLLAIFGSFAAASLPLLLGAVSVLVTGAIIYFLSQSIEMSVFVTNVASMIGIGVAIDYSLIVLSRYRQEVHAGRTLDEARATAMATSGVAVAFSGMTVIASLAGLWMIDNESLRSLALGAMLVVSVAVLVSSTLLPAMIGLYGRRAHSRSRALRLGAVVDRIRRPKKPEGAGEEPKADFWTRWTGFVTRHAVVCAIASAAVLIALAIPALSLHTSTGALRQLDRNNETRVGFDRAAKVVGPGASGPAAVLVRLRHGTVKSSANARIVRRVRRVLGRDAQVATVGRAQPSRDRRSILVPATLKTDPESPVAKDAVGRLREALARPSIAERASASIGGTTALQKDMEDAVAGGLWKVILVVLALSYLVLLFLLRSVLLPLKAVVMNLLSVGAAYGVLVAVFQHGWLDGLFGFQSLHYVDTLTPPLILAIAFGLSMDYEVFLMTRIRERWEATGDSTRAVAEGLAGSAKTITSAALILVAVFAVFVGTGVQSIKELGVGASVAIALDATLTRLVLVPATMRLLGRWNWWLPRPLERILPRAPLEGEAPSAATQAPFGA
jgi:uncharacterized membrane protein YdfJ with MMPL/SSD domain